MGWLQSASQGMKDSKLDDDDPFNSLRPLNSPFPAQECRRHPPFWYEHRGFSTITVEAITAIPFTGLIDANCKFTVYSRSSTNGPVRSYISNFVLEVKLLLFQPWSPPTSARRLLVLRHGPSARLQGVAVFSGMRPFSLYASTPHPARVSAALN